MQAIILAAGRGERLRPLTDSTPKPLILVEGQSMIAHALNALPDAVTEIVIVVGYLGELIEKIIGFSWKGKPVRYVRQENGRTGTFAALSAAKKILSERFLVLASDVFYKKDDLTNLLNHTLALLVRKEVGDDSRRIAQCIVENEILCGINEGETPKGKVFANSSAYVLDKRIFDEPVVRGENGEEWLSVMVGNLASRVPIRTVVSTFHATITNSEDIPRVENKLRAHLTK
ncbi:MAG: bifunctional UDP-N-acetylglucosamine pyrophosphorylase / Glucosamine-1-phosphate N-acetyltransferase [Parcubacteria group bacterium Gr01-1014_17]|nr:MAG: bifunctional UDP-N-acetylglucosamine pyrophosphorylase / Glucosamine-1-phosphate N-acetyltransferase [Parcubacteria group bacterium Gr01-1014_17]